MQRRAINEAVAARVAALDRYGGEPQRIEIVAIEGARFVASCLVEHRPQTGSHWTEHYLFAGTEAPLSIDSECRRTITEQAWEFYDPQVALGEVVAHVRAGGDGPCPSAEEDQAERLAQERAAALCASAPAVESRLIAACPKCGSTRAGLHERIFEISDLRCEACGHRELVDLAAEGDEWHRTIVLGAGAEIPAFIAPRVPAVESPQPPAQESPPVTSPAETTTAGSPLPELPFDPGPAVDSLAPGIRCPRCGSPDVADDPGSAMLHYSFLRCRSCDFGEEISSMSAVSRWNRA
ncbi:MAG: hypothetical protein JSR82_12750 [Verrucomicrobia bacterium]|nr:hypothetical protein [Verrucomicrobiota bacterium]